MLKWRKAPNKLVLTLLISAIIIIPINAYSDALSDMYTRWGIQATGTAPNVYEGQTRGFAVGGRANIRTNSEMFQPFTVKAPNFKAGCQGLDIFAGSFSWINAEQFTKTMRAIGQNALGYAFSLGLEVVCPTCSAQLNKLQHFMNQINKMSADSCQAAKALVNAGVNELTGNSVEECVNKKGNEAAGDFVQGWMTCQNDSEANIRATLRQEGADWWGMAQADPKVRLPSTQAGTDTARQAVKGMGFSDEEKSLMISVLGTYNVEGDDGLGGGGACKYYGPTVGLTDLVDGGTLSILECKNGSMEDTQACHQYGPQPTTKVGYKEMVRIQMTAIYTKLLNNTGSGAQLSDDQKNFINTVPSYPVYTIVNSLARMGKSNEPIANSVIQMYSGLIAVEYAQATIERYIYALLTGSPNVTSACMKNDPGFKTTIRDVRDVYYKEYKKYAEKAAEEGQALAFMDRVYKGQFSQSKAALTSALGAR